MGLTVPPKGSKLTLPESNKFTVIKESHGFKLVETENKDYMIIGKTIVHKYKSSAWAEKKFKRVEKVYEKLNL
jgi:hypothetical protein